MNEDMLSAELRGTWARPDMILKLSYVCWRDEKSGKGHNWRFAEQKDKSETHRMMNYVVELIGRGKNCQHAW